MPPLELPLGMSCLLVSTSTDEKVVHRYTQRIVVFRTLPGHVGKRNYDDFGRPHQEPVP